ncbi:hypothetical protein LTR36_000907 [Oleoguttula mirabilis]|uniref:Uncharacterized protein n=1 Tax=Oleoguttula mirabilis TaxID=1507867 RepID=A0AAV9JPD6_9PEZI|nr:hypothetical protein LTR36_000907 [Oleoguttula mirabilis]
MATHAIGQQMKTVNTSLDSEAAQQAHLPPFGEAARELQSLVATIHSNLAYTTKMIAQYGNTLLKRWHKRNAEKRASLLLKAMPDMFKQRSAPAQILLERKRKFDAALLRTIEKQSSDGRAAVNMALEVSLSQDASQLLKLLQNKSHFEPAEWVMFDHDQVRLMFDTTCCVPIAYNPHCVSMRPDSFGQLVEWERDPAHSFAIIGYPRARLILQAQAEVSTFLRRVTALLLENQLADASNGRDKWDASAASGFTNRAYSGLELARVNPAFTAPPEFDLEQVVTLLQATQPRMSYEAEKALRIQRQYEVQIRDSAVPPAEYDMALRELQFALEAKLPGMSAELSCIAEQTGNFRDHLKRDTNGQITVHIKSREEIFNRDPLLWNVIELVEYDHHFSFDPSWHIAFNDDVLSRASLKERSRIDTFLYGALSDFAAVSDAITALKHRRPHHGPRLTDDQYQASLSESTGCAKFIVGSNVVSLLLGKGRELLCSHLKPFTDLQMPPAKVNEKSFDRAHNLHLKLALPKF